MYLRIIYLLSFQIFDINQKPIPSEYGLMEVHSAFGGAGLYEACEHVPFHLCIREKNNQGRIFINFDFQIS
jgi:hypothetical protein